jgi:hypothetical protein
VEEEEYEMGETYNTHETKSSSCTILVVKPKGKRPLVKPTRRQDNIKADYRIIGHENVYWIQVAQDRAVSLREYGSEILGSITAGPFLSMCLFFVY